VGRRRPDMLRRSPPAHRIRAAYIQNVVKLRVESGNVYIIHYVTRRPMTLSACVDRVMAAVGYKKSARAFTTRQFIFNKIRGRGAELHG